MKKSGKAILIIILICVFAVSGMLLGLNLGRTSAQTAPSNNELGAYPEHITDNIENVSNERVSIPSWRNITIPAGKTNIEIELPNPESNANKYYLSFEISLKETGETLYTSGLVTPGLHISSIKLSRALKKGEYEAIVRVQSYKMDNARTPANNADLETTLIVVE